MSDWFTWRTTIGSILLGFAFAAALFWASDRTFSLSGVELFFAVTTVISLALNLWQLFRDRYKYAPLKASLIGLFNDLKGRQLRAHQRQQLITSPAGNALPREATQLEFYDFVRETILGLDQLREHVVAAIHTVDPGVSNQQVFRAAEFGLNEQEMRHRVEAMERFIQQDSAAADGSLQSQTAHAAEPPTAPPENGPS